MMPVFASAEEVQESVCLVSLPKKFVTLPDLSMAGVKDRVVDSLMTVPEKIDVVAESLAGKMESTKKISSNNAEEGKALGVLEGGEVDQEASRSTLSNMTASAYNAGVDVLALLLRHWLLTLGGLMAGVLLWSFRA